MGNVVASLTPSFCSNVDEKKKISRQIDKEILQELKQEAGLYFQFYSLSDTDSSFKSSISNIVVKAVAVCKNTFYLKADAFDKSGTKRIKVKWPLIFLAPPYLRVESTFNSLLA